MPACTDFLETILKRATNIKISKAIILLGNDCNLENNIITIIAYLIYKEWLISKNENTTRTWNTSARFLLNELNYRISFYNLIHNPKLKQLLLNIKS